MRVCARAHVVCKYIMFSIYYIAVILITGWEIQYDSHGTGEFNLILMNIYLEGIF